VSARTIDYETSADGFGELATDDDRDSFVQFVAKRLGETYPGYECSASWSHDVLESRVHVDGDADAPDESELKSWIGGDLWEEWCANADAGVASVA